MQEGLLSTKALWQGCLMAKVRLCALSALSALHGLQETEGRKVTRSPEGPFLAHSCIFHGIKKYKELVN